MPNFGKCELCGSDMCPGGDCAESAPDNRGKVEEPAAPGPRIIPRMTESELREFVLGVCDNQIFTDKHIPPSQWESMVRSIFMVLGLGGLAEWTPEELNEIGCIWEWMREAGPRSINGYPMFMSLRLLHKEDWARAKVALERESKRRENIKV